MLNWRCPHCRAPQPESSRCWVCRRSTTTCATCVHFRRAIAGKYAGTCGRFPGPPLRGDELRGCWQPPAPLTSRGGFPPFDLVAQGQAAPGGLWADPESERAPGPR